MVDLVRIADPINHRREGVWMPGLVGTLDAVIGYNRMDLIRYRCQPMTKDVGGNGCGHARMPLGRGELVRMVDDDEQLQVTLCCMHFCHVQIKVSKEIRLERFL
jgi:hypothetical protein